MESLLPNSEDASGSPTEGPSVRLLTPSGPVQPFIQNKTQRQKNMSAARSRSGSPQGRGGATGAGSGAGAGSSHNDGGAGGAGGAGVSGGASWDVGGGGVVGVRRAVAGPGTDPGSDVTPPVWCVTPVLLGWHDVVWGNQWPPACQSCQSMSCSALTSVAVAVAVWPRPTSNVAVRLSVCNARSHIVRPPVVRVCGFVAPLASPGFKCRLQRRPRRPSSGPRGVGP